MNPTVRKRSGAAGTRELLRGLERTPEYVQRHKTTPEDAIRGCLDEEQLPMSVAEENGSCVP